MNLNLSNTDFTLQWWVEGQLVAEVRTPETGDGFIFYCESCERAWGAKYFPNRATMRFYGSCAGCPPSRGEIPGSLILWWHDELERMPAALVEREYALHLAYYDKEQSNETHSGDTRSSKVDGPVPAGILEELEGGAGAADRPGA